MKRITGLTAALFLVLGITATSFAQDTMKQDTMMKQDTIDEQKTDDEKKWND